MLSVVAALATRFVESAPFSDSLPRIEYETVEALLEILAASMLVIATLSVASMVSAYASASNSATPRTFPLIISDDLSQNALSSFVGAFIFSIVALIAQKNGYYGQAGFSVLFVLTLLVFAFVVFTFVRWVDGIARLGRLGNTVDKVEAAAEKALERRRLSPTLGGKPLRNEDVDGVPVSAVSVGYVQHVKIDVLQAYAEAAECEVFVTALPGMFAVPGAALVHVTSKEPTDDDHARVRSAFIIGDDRTFEEDPRFGLVVLSEIACRALSPAVNDPGTAIDIIGTFIRLFDRWAQPADEETCRFDRVRVPTLSVDDMFDDAFTAIARDGAGLIEVAVRLQKSLRALAAIGDDAMTAAAHRHSQLALSRAERTMQLPQEIEIVRAAAVSAHVDV